jgi:hypothetical protein
MFGIVKIEIPKERQKQQNRKCCRLGVVGTVQKRASYRPRPLTQALAAMN